MADTQLAWACRHFARYGPRYRRYAQFYEGEHPSLLTVDQARSTISRLLGELRDNLMPVVVDSLVDRLLIQGFEVSNPEASKYLGDLWTESRMETQAIAVHCQAALFGDAFLIMWPDSEGIPRFYPQSCHEVAVRYASDGLGSSIAEAVKAWQVTDSSGRLVLRVNRYFPDRIERFITRGGLTVLPESVSELSEFAGDGDPAVIPNHYGCVPVVHFSNALDPEQFASSEIRDVIPLQLALNKLLLDEATASEFGAFPQRWATGIELPRDPETGEPVEDFTAAVDRLWTSANPDTRFGQFESADLGRYVASQNDKRSEIARVSRTPLHLMGLGGDFPSGEALRTAEAPLLAKVARRQAGWGDAWENAAGLALLTAGYENPGTIRAIWADTSPKSTPDEVSVGDATTQI